MVGTLRSARPTKFQGSRVLDRAHKAAEARRTCDRFERWIAFLFGKGKTRLRITSLRCLVADQERDRSLLESGSPSGCECVIDQSLHQPSPAILRQRRNMLDQPVALTALHPAIPGVGAAL